MHLYERTKVISLSRETLYERCFFHKQRDKKTIKYAKNVLYEGLKLKGLILFAEYRTCSSNAEVVYDNMPHLIRNPIECPFG